MMKDSKMKTDTELLADALWRCERVQKLKDEDRYITAHEEDLIILKKEIDRLRSIEKGHKDLNIMS